MARTGNDDRGSDGPVLAQLGRVFGGFLRRGDDVERAVDEHTRPAVGNQLRRAGVGVNIGPGGARRSGELGDVGPAGGLQIRRPGFQVAAAAEVHLIKGSYQAACDANVMRLIGALHQWKVGGDITIKGKMVTLMGATGTLSGGGSSIKLGGGPVVITGTKVACEAPMIVKIGGTMKIGPG